MELSIGVSEWSKFSVGRWNSPYNRGFWLDAGWFCVVLIQRKITF